MRSTEKWLDRSQMEKRASVCNRNRMNNEDRYAMKLQKREGNLCKLMAKIQSSK